MSLWVESSNPATIYETFTSNNDASSQGIRALLDSSHETLLLVNCLINNEPSERRQRNNQTTNPAGLEKEVIA